MRTARRARNRPSEDVVHFVALLRHLKLPRVRLSGYMLQRARLYLGGRPQQSHLYIEQLAKIYQMDAH